MIAVAGLAVILTAGGAMADVLGIPVYGGPTYDKSSGDGYLINTRNTSIPSILGSTAGSGIVNAQQFSSNNNIGYRAICWDDSGWTMELGNLGTTSGGVTNVYAYATNHSGTVVGYASKYVDGTFGGQCAVRWDSNGVATELGNLGLDSNGLIGKGTAYAINNAGTAVGTAQKYAAGVDMGTRAVRWNASGTAATELGHLGTDNYGYTYSTALAINASGTCVGSAEKYVAGQDVGYRPVRWDASGTAATELQNLGTDNFGATYCEATALNNSGTCVGFAEKYVAGVDVGFRPVRWDASGKATELDILGTGSTGQTWSRPLAINDTGLAVGFVGKFINGVGCGTRAARWDASGTEVTELGNIGTDSNGVAFCTAVAVNYSGIAVGYANKNEVNSSVNCQRAVMWDADGAAVDLNTLIGPSSGWVLEKALGISQDNWVTGIGSFDPDGTGPLPAYERAFLMAVPGHVLIPGDADGNGKVDFNDYLVLECNFGTVGSATIDAGDFNDDGNVDFNDYLVLEANFNTGVAAPEPATLGLLTLGGLALIRRRFSQE